MNATSRVLVSGNFNVLHPGHMRLLKFAKECGAKLIVAVNSDLIAGKSAFVQESLRLEGVQSNVWVDEAFIAYSTIEEIIDKLRPEIIVKGKEHESKYNRELISLKKYGGKLLFSSGETIFSSEDLISKEHQAYKNHHIAIPKQFMERHKIGLSDLHRLVIKFQEAKVCVVGDLIIDEYITCQPLGMSQEDPTIVVSPIDSAKFLGGAAIVSGHAAKLGAEVNFISVMGNDDVAKFALKNLEENNVYTNVFEDVSRPTTLKQRYRCHGKTLLRVSHLHQSEISTDIQIKIIKYFQKISKKINILIFSDFNYGVLSQKVVDEITTIAKKYNILIIADSQSSSQMGNIARFKGANLITPTEREARLAIRNRDDGLIVLSEKLRLESLANNIFLKLGENGMIVNALGDSKKGYVSDQIEALNNSPKDVAGAGDSLLTASALTLGVGGNIWEAAVIGSLAAAIQVGKIGNIPLENSELIKEFQI